MPRSQQESDIKSILTASTLAATVVLCACTGMSSNAAGPTAVATMKPTQGNTTAGTIKFEQQGDKVIVSADISGLQPNQEHGLHAHEKGDCSSTDGMSTGGHFNPSGHQHGNQGEEHHAGDMPALKADAQGKAVTRFELKGVSIGSGAADLVGRGLIIHAKPDDYKTQPTGNSGARIACGVITKS